MSARIVVLVSGRGSNLRAIDDAIRNGRCDATLVAVVSDQPDAPALSFARDRGYEAVAVPYRKGDDRAAWNVALTREVALFEPTLVVLAGFMRILGASFIDTFPRRIVNVHPSLLPAFPGHDGPAQAIRAGVRVSGCTVHLVDHGVDTGPILAQGVVPVLPGDDVASLHARIQSVEHRLLPATIDAIAKGEITVGDASASPALRASFDETARLVVPSLLDTP